MFRFAIRDVLWLTLVVAMGVGWFVHLRAEKAAMEEELRAIDAEIDRRSARMDEKLAKLLQVLISDGLLRPAEKAAMEEELRTIDDERDRLLARKARVDKKIEELVEAFISEGVLPPANSEGLLPPEEKAAMEEELRAIDAERDHLLAREAEVDKEIEEIVRFFISEGLLRPRAETSVPQRGKGDKSKY